jgi:hypothetical protein
MNLSQLLTIMSGKSIAREVRAGDALLGELFTNIDEEHYKAQQKVNSLRWGSLLLLLLRALWRARHVVGKTISAFLYPEKFYRYHKKVIDEAVYKLQHSDYSSLSLRELIERLDDELTPVISKAAFPPIFPFIYYMSRLEKLFGAWDGFAAQYGLRGPGELELANSRYGDDPRLALEQMSYMVDSDNSKKAHR